MLLSRLIVKYSSESPCKYIADQIYIDLLAHKFLAVSGEIKKRLNMVSAAMYIVAEARRQTETYYHCTLMYKVYL